MHEPQYPRLERRFKRWFITSETCDRLIVHCEAVSDVVIDELGLPPEVRDRIDVIPHGHYLDNYKNELDRAEARRSLELPQSSTVFLFFGLIRRYKGIDTLIDAFQKSSVSNGQLLIAGNPASEALESELTAQSKGDDRIHCLFEFVPDDEIQRYMNAADAVVLPYREITTSGSAVLAMSFGNALVVPSLGCLPELLDEEGAVFFDPTDDRGLIAALEAATERDLKEMGRHNENSVRQYSWENIATQTERTYKKA